MSVTLFGSKVLHHEQLYTRLQEFLILSLYNVLYYLYAYFKFLFTRRQDRVVDKALDHESRDQGFESQAGQVTIVLFGLKCHKEGGLKKTNAV